MWADFPRNKHLKQAIYRGPGGAGDATGDATNASALALAARDEAQASATSAASSATAAANSATAADTSADDAATSATNAAGSASTASTAATNASNSASDASDSATAAASSASDAADSATAAASSASAASSSASSASTSASSASSSASSASTSASTATTKASEAATSATNAASSASTASTAATNASNSASAAATSETNAASSASSASSSASTATTKASEASSSASSASTSASTATTKASEASTSASNAATSATNAANSASAAATSATSAASSATAAAASAVTAATFDPALYLSKSGNLSGLANTVTAANNLGINPYGNGFKNRIINGGMVIDQRVNGTVSTTSAFIVDRWINQCSVSSKISSAKSSTAPSGFISSSYSLVSNAYTAGASEAFGINQRIEGLNVYDLGFGTSSAQPVTLSFWVRSSITGTYSGSLRNGTGTRANTFTYTINSANTWEQKSVTISGDTSGTWATDNSTGFDLWFDLGSGSNFNSPAGTWASGNYIRSSAAISWMQNAGATFYITGVQLEKGSTATSFDYRPYGTELALCQRYYQKSYSPSVVPGALSSDGRVYFILGAGTNTANKGGNIQLKVNMRTSPTVLLYNEATGASGQFGGGGTASYLVLSDNSFAAYTNTAVTELYAAWTASSEL